MNYNQTHITPDAAGTPAFRLNIALVMGNQRQLFSLSDNIVHCTAHDATLLKINGQSHQLNGWTVRFYPTLPDEVSASDAIVELLAEDGKIHVIACRSGDIYHLGVDRIVRH